jgi:cysteine desulfurase
VSPATNCVPGILNVAFPGIEAEVLAQAIGDRVAASLGAACHGASREPSHVLSAIGLRKDLLFSAVRFGLGKPTTKDEIERAAKIIVQKVKTLRLLQGS